MSVYNVEIIHQDGTEELVAAVDSMTVQDGVLHLWFMGYNSASAYVRHRGSYPLTGIRRYRKVD